MTFGEKLQYLRKAKGMSQEQLAGQMTVSRQAVSKWELDAAMPDTDNIIQISKLFDVTTDWLLMGDDDVPEKISLSPLSTAENRETKTMLLKVLRVVLTVAGIALILFLITLGFSLIPN